MCSMAMEVFNLILRKNIENAEYFKYHQGCKNLKITHLGFVADLIVFSHGDCRSVSVIKKTIEEFSIYFGLKVNMQKSSIFFGGLFVPEQTAITQILPFTIGKLPIRYLGVSLITKQLSATDCKPLIDKVKIRVNDWRNRSLSYAGRLQLIASILSSIQVY